MTRRPLVPLALAFALGAACPPSPAAFTVAGAALLGVAWSPVAPFAFAAFAAFGWAARTGAAPAGGSEPVERVVVEGLVTSVPERFDEKIRFTLREADGRILLAWSTSPDWPLALGDRVRFPARLRRPEGARNPGGRDPAALLAVRGISLEASALAEPVRVAPPSPLAALEQGRRRFAALASEVLPPREAGLVRAIGAGDRDGVDAPTNDAFARSGLAHVLSVSGLHLAVVAFGADRLLRALIARSDRLASRVEPRRAAAALAIPLTAVYAVATGASVPALRSAVATGAAFAGVLLAREREPLNTIALAAIAILAVEPGAAFDISFQLSFASVAGLALLTLPIRESLPLARPPPEAPRLARAGEALLLALCASAAATVATAPLVAFHFRRVSLAGLVSNVPGVPLGSALTIAASCAALASGFSTRLATALLWLARPLASLLLWLNDACAAPAWASPGIASPGLAAVAGFFVAGLLALRARGAWRAGWTAVAIAALVLPGPLRRLAASDRALLEVVFVGVGQGDATVLRLPDGSAVLVDAGGDPQGRADPGARDVVPFLRDAGVTTIAAAFLSHPHPDHLGGLPSVHAAIPFETFRASGRAMPPEATAAIARLPPAEPFPRGATWDRAGVRIEALGPPPENGPWTENDASLVLRVTYGKTRFLLLGDVEAEGEAALVAAGGLAADVVKIAHHGSATSSTAALVDAVRPQFAVACVGHENRYHFPAPAVVERWREAGAAVRRTDGGAIRFVSDGVSVRETAAESAFDVLALWRERP